jgi:hypothetical protein
MTPADLARILAQPGYSVDDPLALLPSTAAQEGKGDDLPAQGIQYTKSHLAQRHDLSAQSWRSEREFMAAVITECDLRAIEQPEYGLVCHIPNENSHRQPGVRAGACDLFLPVARGEYHGWFCELKVGSGKCSQKQLDMHRQLRAQGYRVVVIWDSVGEVMAEIEQHLGERL